MGQGCQRPRGIQLEGLGSTQQGRKDRSESGDFLNSAVHCWPPCPLRLSERQEEGAGVWQAGTFGIVTSEAPRGGPVGVSPIW